MKKRVLSLLMALVLCFSMLPTAVLAGEADTAAQKAQSTDGTDGAYANGEGTKAPEGIALMAANAADMPQGTGTAEDPYLIGTKEELQWFRDTVNDGEPGICAKLTANIIFKDGDGAWAPIGTEENQYTGTFDGNDYTITFTYATAPTGMEKGWGLFGYIGSDGTVQALNMIINYFGWSGNSFKVPESGALAAYNAGTIERCTAINSYQLYVTGAVGLLAYQNDGTIQDCLANIGYRYNNLGSVGGVVYLNNGTIHSCFFNTANGSYMGPGMNDHAIAFEKGADSSIANCYYQSERPTSDTTEGVSMVYSSDISSGKLTVMLNNDGNETGSKTEPWRINTSSKPRLSRTDSRVRYDSASGGYIIEGKPHMHGDVEFTRVTALSDITGDGRYCLDGAVALDKQWSVPAGDVTLCLNGQTITADPGIAAISVNSRATLTLLDCSSDNAGRITGGKYGVWNFGIFTMLGGEITGNKTGIYALNGITVGGKAKVTGNTDQNVLLADGEMIYFDALDASARFGISAAGQDGLDSDGRITVTDDSGGQYFGQLTADGFKDDGTGFELYLDEDGKTVTLGRQSVHTHCICGASYINPGHTAHQDVTFLPWTGTDSLPQEGNYYLTRNVTLTSSATLKKANICLNGYTVTLSGSATRIYAGGNGTFKNSVGALTDCTDKGTVTGGKVLIQYSSTFRLYGGTLDGTPVELHQSGGTFDMYGGKITNYTGDVSPVSGQNSKTIFINLYGGEISGNHVTKESGGVWVGAGNRFVMRGGTIRDNSGADAGGVGFAPANTTYSVGTMTVSGSAVVKGNTVNGSKNNVALPTGKTIGVNGTLSGASIGVTVSSLPTEAKSVKIAVGEEYSLTDTDANGFIPDAGGTFRFTLDAAGGTLYLAVPPHQHPVRDGADVTWQAIADEAALRGITAGSGKSYYFLADNITLTQTWEPANGVVLDLNGHSIMANGDFDAISVGDSVGFTLTDCNGSKGTYTFRLNFSTGKKWNLRNNSDAPSDITVEGGIITHDKDKSGRGVNVAAGGSFTMYGGTIIGNTTGTQGAGAAVAADASFAMYGGSIIANVVTDSGSLGGGVYSLGTTTIGGDASLYKNNVHTGGKGAGIYCGGGTLTLAGTASVSGNAFSNNDGGALGAGVYVTGGAALTVGGNAEISGNLAMKGGGAGGGVYLDNGSLVLKDSAKITGNQVLAEGSAGVYVGADGRMSVSGGVQVTGNITGNPSVPRNVYLAGKDTDGTWTVDPITVTGTLDGASIGVNLSNGV